jgi:hypothetical protein
MNSVKLDTDSLNLTPAVMSIRSRPNSSQPQRLYKSQMDLRNDTSQSNQLRRKKSVSFERQEKATNKKSILKPIIRPSSVASSHVFFLFHIHLF